MEALCGHGLQIRAIVHEYALPHIRAIWVKLVYGSEAEKAQKTITDTELLTMFAKAQLLEDDDRKCVKSLLKAFLFQKDMIKQLG